MSTPTPKSTKKPHAKPVLPNVLVVCHGNTHRSALAHAVLAGKLGDERVRSCGVKPGAKGPAAKKVREWAATKGYDLSNHRAREVSEDLLRWVNEDEDRPAGIILYMDGGNLLRLETKHPGLELTCLAGYLDQTRIPDPAFIPRGPQLDTILELVVACSEECARRILKENS